MEHPIGVLLRSAANCLARADVCSNTCGAPRMLKESTNRLECTLWIKTVNLTRPLLTVALIDLSVQNKTSTTLRRGTTLEAVGCSQMLVRGGHDVWFLFSLLTDSKIYFIYCLLVFFLNLEGHTAGMRREPAREIPSWFARLLRLVSGSC